MNLKRALILSCATHLLLFGGAAAFGLFAGSGSALSGDIAMVSLVNAEKAGEGTVKQNRRKPVPVPQEPAFSPISSLVTAVDKDDGDRSESDREESIEEGIENATDQAANAPSGGIGLVSPEEWQLIQAAIERAKSYPRLARERGIQGVVHVRFRVAEGGMVDDVQVVRSSGSAILDSASIKTVYSASPMPHVKGWVEVPMAYVLK